MQSEILVSVWKNIHVKEDLVREYIFDLRDALGDSAKAPSYIETVRGRGYRLIGPIEIADATKFMSQRPALAVLRPQVHSSSPRWRHIADAFSEDLVIGLIRYPELSVIGPQSAEPVFQESKDNLETLKSSTDYLLKTTLEPWEWELRARFQLVRSETGEVIWSRRWDNPLTDITRLLSELTISVVAAVASWDGEIARIQRVSAARCGPAALNAYEHYLLLAHCELSPHRESIAEGIKHGEASLELDPDFARTWYLLSCLYERGPLLFGENDGGKGAHMARSAINKALELDARDPMILVQAGFLFAGAGQRAEAIEHIFRAADLGRNEALTAGLISLGLCTVADEFDEADSLLQEAIRLNVLHRPEISLFETRVAFFSERFDRCIEIAEDGPPLLPTLLFKALSLALTDTEAATRDARTRLFEAFPSLDLRNYAQVLPIAGPKAQTLYFEACDRLVETAA